MKIANSINKLLKVKKNKMNQYLIKITKMKMELIISLTIVRKIIQVIKFNLMKK